jgi:beta-galactosidase
VWAFTNLEEVRLALNGRDIGARKVERFGHAEWQVPWEPGRLEAVGYRGGREVLRTVVETTGQPARIALSADRGSISADGRDLAVVTVSALDDKARPVRVAGNDVSFEVSGPGRIIGVGNGDPSSHEADVFPGTPLWQRIENWRMTPLTEEPGQVLTLTELKNRGGRPVSVDAANASGLPENSFYAFWTSFTVRAENIAAGSTTLMIGQVDDSGRVYLNGRLLGTTDNWDRSYSFDAAGLLQPGANDLIVLVRNKAGRGGIGRGVSLAGGLVRPPIRRRLFNGLAQVLLQSTGAPGDITLRATGTGLDPATLTVRARNQ